MLDPALAQQREKFIAKFGREPRPDDPIFFDLDEDALRADTVKAMRAAGIRPALIYAHEKTGLLVTTENRNMISDVDLLEWDEASQSTTSCTQMKIPASTDRNGRVKGYERCL